MRRTFLKTLSVCVATSFASAAMSSAVAKAPESNDPIKIALFDWTSVNINAKILGGIFKKLGYNVEFPTGDYLSSLTTGLTNGDLVVGMEFWDTTAREAMSASDATGQTENLGKLGPKAKEEWWYPLYMKDKCPGLPDWHALLDPKCAQAFSTPETAPNGRYLGGPVTWEGFDDERAKALKLPITVVHAGTDGAMWAELDSAYQRKAPILMWIYSPHWAPSKYKGEWVQFPDFYPTCYSDKKYDCGKPHGEIWKYSWKGMKDKWPVAYKIAKNYTIDTEQLNALSGDVDLGGKSIDDVAAAWVEKNEAVWSKWAQ